MLKKILIVEDEPGMQIGLKDNLEFEGYKVETANDGEEGLNMLSGKKYDLLILDVMLPKMSGFEVCRTIRKKGIDLPVILLTAKSEEIDKVIGLELGADDYITKPFGLREFLARIKAVLRRGSNKPNPDDSIIKLGRLSANFQTYQAFYKGIQIKMSHKEISVLEYLWTHKNKIVSRNDLLEKIWGYHEFPTTRTIDNFILKLRQKIEEDPNNPEIIITVHGAGYKMIGI
ncbi:response regulator transcription factor [Chondrinema litorale]|uniref:response regulator transcription factor n=1 Tax=Chondrinema litorale TaxID=2994555 RepID=UPI002542F0FF|nr:response regulator transcription factor [Chondrinema litorale]UZR93277.1 response regulator transcription factor [Chondrinema litorale]